MNKWNTFQSYAVHPDGYGMAKKDDQSKEDFQQEIHDLYNDEGEAELEEIVEWYRMELAAQTVKLRAGGYTPKELEKFSLPFINRV